MTPTEDSARRNEWRSVCVGRPMPSVKEVRERERERDIYLTLHMCVFTIFIQLRKNIQFCQETSTKEKLFSANVSATLADIYSQ